MLRRQAIQAVGPSGPLAQQTEFEYDNGGRLKTVKAGNLSATYTREANREAVGQIVYKREADVVLRTRQGFDGLGRLKAVSSTTADGTVVSRVEYQFNRGNQRERASREDGTDWTYGYDTLGQLILALHRLADGTAVLGEQFGYSFDRIGNRVQTEAVKRQWPNLMCK